MTPEQIELPPQTSPRDRSIIAHQHVHQLHCSRQSLTPAAVLNNPATVIGLYAFCRCTIRCDRKTCRCVLTLFAGRLCHCLYTRVIMMTENMMTTKMITSVTNRAVELTRDINVKEKSKKLQQQWRHNAGPWHNNG